MASRGLRRRLNHADVDGGKNNQRFHSSSSQFDSLNEPLLPYRHTNIYTQDHVLDETLIHRQLGEQQQWTLLFSQLIAQWAQWLANFVCGSGSLIARLLPFVSSNSNGPIRRVTPRILSPLQEARLRHLKERLAVPYDGSFVEHQDALRQLWKLAFPDRQLPSLKSELWKEMGWQGVDPSTDFRGGGFISLENLIFFATAYPGSFQNLLHKKNGRRSEWEYPFAVAGINVSFMLVQMLDLQSGTPSTSAGIRFLELLNEDEMAFDNLFCIAFELLDANWLAKHASYMEFNEIIKSTRTQLEKELALEDISSIKDLPAYNLLRI